MSETAMKDDVARGRALVEAGQHFRRGMIDNLALIAYFKQQRELVSIRGHCSARCQCEQVEHPRGYAVCPHTFEPCKGSRLVEIVKLFSKVNS